MYDAQMKSHEIIWAMCQGVNRKHTSDMRRVWDDRYQLLCERNRARRYLRGHALMGKLTSHEPRPWDPQAG
ncbi:hypothetical protein VTO73DRAFT_11573 [Trametes versicolor]